MADGLATKEILRIGYRNADHDTGREQFQQYYDIVIDGHQEKTETDLVQLIFGGKS